jgi:lactam utilization protein B
LIRGFHAGDPSVMQKSVLLCKKYGVQVGAHPGLPDLQGFGRRKMAISPAEAEADVIYQIGALIENEEEAIARVLQMAKQGTVGAVDGSTVALQADSVCVHGDGPKALAFVRKISAALPAAGVEIKAQ